jgi:hypothetical protein
MAQEMTVLHLIEYQTEGPTPGRITGFSSVPLEALKDDHEIPPGLVVESKPSFEEIKVGYVDEGQLIPRPPFDATLDGLTLSGVPLGTALTITGPTGKTQTYTTDNETITLAFPKAGVYKLDLAIWPYLPKSFEVTV